MQGKVVGLDDKKTKARLELQAASAAVAETNGELQASLKVLAAAENSASLLRTQIHELGATLEQSLVPTSSTFVEHHITLL